MQTDLPPKPPVPEQRFSQRTEQAEKKPVSKPTIPQSAPLGSAGCIYEIPSMKGTSPEDIGLVEMTRSAIIGSDDPELEELDDPSRIPPGRGI